MICSCSFRWPWPWVKVTVRVIQKWHSTAAGKCLSLKAPSAIGTLISSFAPPTSDVGEAGPISTIRPFCIVFSVQIYNFSTTASNTRLIFNLYYNSNNLGQYLSDGVQTAHDGRLMHDVIVMLMLIPMTLTLTSKTLVGSSLLLQLLSYIPVSYSPDQLVILA